MATFGDTDDTASAEAAAVANTVGKAESSVSYSRVLGSFDKVATETTIPVAGESNISQVQIPTPRIPSLEEVVLPNALNIPPVASTLAVTLHAQMTSAAQQQQQHQHQQQHEKQPLHPHQLHSDHHQHRSHQHQHHQKAFTQYNQQLQQHQQESKEQQQLFHQQRSQLIKMDAEFWQQARGPFGLHAAAALATNQLHHHHQQNPLQHQQQQSHSQQQQHIQSSVQTHHVQQSQHLANVTTGAVAHQDQQQQQSSSTLPPQEQHQQNHHLLFNAAAAAAAAVHLSGVVKSNELQNGINVSGVATSSPTTQGDTAEGNNNASGNSNGSCYNKAGSSERLSISVKQEIKAVSTSAATSNQHQQQQQQSKYQPNVHNAIDVLHHQLQQQLQQQHNLVSRTSDGDETGAFNNQLKAQPVSGLSSSNSAHQQHAQAQNTQSRPRNSIHAHHQQQEQHHQQLPTHAQSQPKQLQQSNGQQHEMGAGPSSPSLIHSGVGATALVPLHSPQQSLTPSGGSSTPDIKYNSDKLVNEIQVRVINFIVFITYAFMRK